MKSVNSSRVKGRVAAQQSHWGRKTSRSLIIKKVFKLTVKAFKWSNYSEHELTTAIENNPASLNWDLGPLHTNASKEEIGPWVNQNEDFLLEFAQIQKNYCNLTRALQQTPPPYHNWHQLEKQKKQYVLKPYRFNRTILCINSRLRDIYKRHFRFRFPEIRASIDKKVTTESAPHRFKMKYVIEQKRKPMAATDLLIAIMISQVIGLCFLRRKSADLDLTQRLIHFTHLSMLIMTTRKIQSWKAHQIRTAGKIYVPPLETPKRKSNIRGNSLKRQASLLRKHFLETSNVVAHPNSRTTEKQLPFGITNMMVLPLSKQIQGIEKIELQKVTWNYREPQKVLTWQRWKSYKLPQMSSCLFNRTIGKNPLDSMPKKQYVFWMWKICLCENSKCIHRPPDLSRMKWYSSEK